MTVTGAGAYVGTLSTTFSIYGGLAKQLRDATVVAQPVAYTGSAVVPEVTVSFDDGTVLEPGTEYSVSVPSYISAVEPGMYAATITPVDGVGIAGPPRNVNFYVEPCDLGEHGTVIGIVDRPYTGAELEQAGLAVFNGAGKKLVEDEDYVVIDDDNKKVGTASVIIAGIGERYEGVLVRTFEIKATTFKEAGVTASVKNQVYTGKALTPALTIKNSAGVTLVKGTDYLVKYTKNVNVGTAAATVVGKGAYSGTINLSFKITQAANPLATKNVSASFKAANVNKAKQITRSFIKTPGKGSMTYSVTKVTNAKNKAVSTALKKKFTVSAGKVVVAKGTAKGTYKVTASAKAAGPANYKASAVKTATITIKIS